MKRLLIVTTCFIAVGCANINKKMPWYSNEPKPKQLTELKNKIQIREVQKITGNSKPSSYAKHLSPTVHKNLAVLGDDKGMIQLWDIRKGSPVWRMKVEQGLEVSPALSHDKTRIALIDKNDRLRVYDTKKRKLLLNAQLSEESYAKPVIYKDDVIVKTISGDLSVYSVVTGKRRWHYVPELDDVMVKGSSKVLVHNNIVYAGFSDGRVIAFNLQHGHVMWEQSLTDLATTKDVEERFDIVSNPIGDNKHLYVVSFDGQVAALDYKTGRKVWHQPIHSYKDMAQDEQHLFVVTPEDAVYALHKGSGRIAWKLDDYKYRKLSAPKLVGGKLVVYDKEGFVHCLASDTGQTLARLNVGRTLSDARMAKSGKLVIIPLANGSHTGVKIG